MTERQDEPERETAPEPEREPEPAPAPDPVRPESGESARLDRLEGLVNQLVDVVAGLTPKDDRPTKLPWTHRGGRRGDES